MRGLIVRDSKWFKEGEKAFVELPKPGVAECPYGAKSAKALIWEEGFKSAAQKSEQPQ